MSRKLTQASRWLPWHAIVVFGFLYLPIVTLIVYSFNGSGVGGFPAARSHSELVSHSVRRWGHLEFGTEQPLR